MTAPAWIAALAGQAPLAAQVNQLLTTHGITNIYTGLALGGAPTLGTGAVTTNGQDIAQVVVPGTNQTPGRFVFSMSATGSPGPLTVSIQTQASGAPSGTVLASTTIPNLWVPATQTLVSIPLPCGLTASTSYWVVFSAVGDASDYYSLYKSNQTSGVSTSPTGSSWTAQTYGLCYERYDQSPVLPLVHTWEDSGARVTWRTTNTSSQITAIQEATAQQGGGVFASSVTLAYSGTSLLSVIPAAGSQTPVWTAPHNGLIGDASAIASANHVNQFLGTHAAQHVYEGNRILLPKYILTASASPWNTPLTGTDVDQPFVMSGTSIGRIQLPILPVGDGADLLVSLCADNGSGKPGAMICQTRMPASWFGQLSAVAGVNNGSTDAPITTLTGNPLAVPSQQTWSFAFPVLAPYNFPAIAFVGAAASPSATWYGGYIILIGGVSNSNALTGVYTISCSASGALSPTVPQAAFPVPNDGSSASCVAIDAQSGSPVVVNTGGGTAFEGPANANVYTSSLDTAAGTLSSWSVQTALPAAVQNHVMASANGYVYSVGGLSGGAVVNSVNYAQVQNGQIAGWSAAIPLPVRLQLPYVAVTNGFLVVAGGCDASYNAFSSVYYAPINANGSLGPWLSAPPLYSASYNINANPFGGDQGIITLAAASALTFGPSGPSTSWSQDTAGGGGTLPGYLDNGNGQVIEFALTPTENEYGSIVWSLLPYPSVPLPASGLTSGATYHILLQQQGGNEVNFLSTLIGESAYGPTGPTGLTSPASQYAWTAGASASGVPLQAFNNTPPQTVLPGFPWHIWEDQGAKVTTFVNATTPDGRLLGICEATRQAHALNANTGFEAGISPWTCTGGTAAQSAAEVYTGKYSCQVTPSGTAAQVFLTSELLPCMPGQSVTVTGWIRATSAITSEFSLSVEWYTLAGGSISTSSNTVSIPAGTWTEVTNTFTAPSTGTLPYQFTINPTLGGTPASSQVWYVDVCHAHYTYTGAQNTTIAQVPWSGTAWPNQGQPGAPIQLA